MNTSKYGALSNAGEAAEPALGRPSFSGIQRVRLLTLVWKSVLTTSVTYNDLASKVLQLKSEF